MGREGCSASVRVFEPNAYGDGLKPVWRMKTSSSRTDSPIETDVSLSENFFTVHRVRGIPSLSGSKARESQRRCPGLRTCAELVQAVFELSPGQSPGLAPRKHVASTFACARSNVRE